MMQSKSTVSLILPMSFALVSQICGRSTNLCALRRVSRAMLCTSLPGPLCVQGQNVYHCLWFDKVRALESQDESRRLLNWIIDRVIREKRARAFLVSEDHSRD